ncbi:PilZ domain-containing protein [Salinispira pacifica]
MSDRRRNIRVGHRTRVEVTAASGTIAAESIDLSRTGIGIVVRVPENHSDIRSITLHLPSREDPLEIPVRLVRSSSTATADAETDEQLLAFAFEYDADAQRMLIDRYVRDEVARALQEGQEEVEARRVPRCDCSITDVRTAEGEPSVRAIVNLSTEGALLAVDRAVRPGTWLALRFALPDDRRLIETGGEIVYTVEDRSGGGATAGFRFQDLREPYEARIRGFVVENASRSSRRNMQEWFARNRPEEKFETVAIRHAVTIFRAVAEKQVALHAIAGSRHSMVVLRPVHFADGQMLTLSVDCDSPLEPGAVSCSFSLDGTTYYFQGSLSDGADGLVIELPDILYRGEARSYGRKSIASRITLFLPEHGSSPAPEERRATIGRIIDISRRGFRCDLRVPVDAVSLLKPGTHLSYEADESLALGSSGEIRHVRAMTGAASGARPTLVLRLGIEAGIARARCRHVTYDPASWERAKHARTDGGRSAPCENRIVRIRNGAGQEIVATATANRWHVPATLFLLPPAFGKKKEVLAPLASVLVHNFEQAGRNVVVLRYDGIDRPGESYNRNGDKRRGFEMLGYRVSQGEQDMQTVLEYAYDNPYFTVEQLVLVTFSMSSLDGRKLLLAPENHGRIQLWISVMGLPAARTTLGNILGGLDILANYRMGIPTGTSGMLGHLVNMDTLADDLIRNRYAYLTDARYDMSRIGAPVCWVYGSYDRWVEASEVKDIMTIASGGSREMIEIPTGHNLHTSDDALLCYRIITETAFRRLFDDRRRAGNPDRDQMFRLIASERERLSREQSELVEEYWREYLLGKETNSAGYDFYRNIPDFQQFLSREAVLLDVQPGMRVADLGCGTGLFLEALLREISGGARRDGVKTRIEAVDLVQEALDRAKQKATAITGGPGQTSGFHISYNARNLEPSRFAPIRRYLESREPNIDLLRGRVEGLRQEWSDRFASCMNQALDALLRGEVPTEELYRSVSLRCGEELVPIVSELNRAARFLRGRLFQSDLQQDSDAPHLDQLPRGRELSPDSVAELTADKLRFHKLSFGRSSRHSGMGFAPGSFHRVAASLFVSYLFNPEEFFTELYEITAPGGKVLVSSMKPDSDISVIFTEFVADVQAQAAESTPAEPALRNARSMLNEAASLFELAEEGLFRFFTGRELANLLDAAGFREISVESALGDPPQAFIACGSKPPLRR